MEKIEIKYHKDGSCVKINVNGELDASTCVSADAIFRRALREEATAVVVDCEQLRYISSAGIGVLIATYHTCEQKNKALIFYGLQPKVKNVLEILGMDKVFVIRKSRQEALEAAQSLAH